MDYAFLSFGSKLALFLLAKKTSSLSAAEDTFVITHSPKLNIEDESHEPHCASKMGFLIFLMCSV